ncbi:hypothetical protein ACTHGU_05645 [Chitinophagaceae bacterium MMS25-I14]
MKPRILVLYYSQSGQLRQIIDSLTSEIKDDVILDYAVIEPAQSFPFPWKATSFFDAMPETVQRIPGPVKPLAEDIVQKDYDLVILGYQPWFLHPSQPVTAFLQSESAARLLKGRKVLTVIGCRNMWLNAQECMKEELIRTGAALVGNIVLTDSYPNLVSTLTVIRWAFTGQKERSRFLPPAGVQDADIRATKRFGPVILHHLQNNSTGSLHQDLLSKGAIELKPGLVLLEKRGIKNFRYWAKYIRKKGGPGDPARFGRVTQFKRLLIVAIFILSPISNFTAFIQRQLQKKSLLKDVDYFKGLEYEAGRI